MIIKNSFRLVSNSPNILNLSSSIVKSLIKEENSPRHVFAILELKKNSFVHFTKDSIFKYISNIKRRESLQVVNMEYPLPISYNIPTKGLIINLKAVGVKEVSSLNPNDLYALLAYAYLFSKLVTKKIKISESYAKIITNYFLSFYVQVFGKEYGLVGIYASGIPKLKFLTACYILSSFFGYQTNKDLFKKAGSIAPFLYTNEYEQLVKYNFSKIDDFIKSVSDLKVMPGLSITKFTSKLYRFFGINILPGIEDCSRFFSIILTSSIPGSNIVPRLLVKYNEKEYFKLIDIIKRSFK